MLTIDIARDPRLNGPIVRMTGMADFAGMPQLNAALDRVAAPEPEIVVLDLEGLEFIGSAAIGALVEFRKQIRSHAGRVLVAAASQYVGECFRLSRLDHAFERCASVEDAITRVAAG
ncbi:MAG: STAS domain-containing protein [Phycisphaerales bacterium]